MNNRFSPFVLFLIVLFLLLIVNTFKILNIKKYNLGLLGIKNNKDGVL